jgi:hypothetical protein
MGDLSHELITSCCAEFFARKTDRVSFKQYETSNIEQIWGKLDSYPDH